MSPHDRDLGTREGEWVIQELGQDFGRAWETIDAVESRRESIARRMGGVI
jgi:hypothetical protein